MMASNDVLAPLRRRPHGAYGLIDRIDVGDCWEWTGRLDRDGYGHFGKHGRLVHRMLWELLVGPIPDGLQIDHLCRNRKCVNPDHLEPVSSLENTRRGAPRRGYNGPVLRGSDHPNSKKTHCPRGHQYIPENTATNARGARVCRTCRWLHNNGRR
jgi:hypothetical protein